MSTYLSRIADDVAEMRQAALSVHKGEVRIDDASARGPLGRVGRLHRSFVALIRHMAKEHRDKKKIFLAVVIGAIIGTTPLFGLHLLICIMVAVALRLNKFLVYLAANISVPPMIPVLAFCSIQFAHLCLHGRLMAMDYDTLYQHRFDFVLYWAAGAIPVGGLLGLVCGALTLLVMYRLEKNPLEKTTRTKTNLGADAFETRFKSMTAALHRAFLPSGKMAAGFARGKSSGDPVYRMVVREAEGAQRFLDIGGGQGLLSLLVASFYPQIRADVADYDQRKLDAGKLAADALGLSNVHFRNEDVFSDVFSGSAFPRTDFIACIDVLHYQPVEKQRELVAQMSRALPTGGTLVIRDMNGDHRWRTFFTTLQERFSLLCSLTVASQICPRSGRDLVRQLEAEGMAVTAKNAWGATPFSNTLFVARKF